MSHADIRECAFSTFLDSETYDELQEFLFCTIRKAFLAGYEMKRPVFIPQIYISETAKHTSDEKTANDDDDTNPKSAPT